MRIITTFLLLLCWTIANRAVAQDQAVRDAVRLPAVLQTMQRFVDQEKVAGVVTIVSHRGRIIFHEAAGNASREQDAAMKRDTIVRIYSMSKPIVSVAAMMLVERGDLKLDEPIATYLPAFKDATVYVSGQGDSLKTEPVVNAPTVRDLLRHTSGLTYGIFGDSQVDRMYRSAGVMNPSHDLKTMVETLGRLPLLYQPATKFNYSVSTDVLGRVVEVASGQKLDDFLSANLFGPLKMVDTGFFVAKESRSRFSTVYGPSAAGKLQATDRRDTSQFLNDPTWLSGGGGLVSTSSDYMRFAQMLLNDGQLDDVRILKESTVREMTKNQLPDSAFPIGIGGGRRPGIGFGLGVSVVVTDDEQPGIARIGEYGWGGAASTHFWISDKDDLAVVVLTQLMPYTPQMEIALKPLIYRAIQDNENTP